MVLPEASKDLYGTLFQEEPVHRLEGLTGRWRGEAPYIDGVKRGNQSEVEIVQILYEAINLPLDEVLRGLGLTDEGPVSHLSKPSNVREVEIHSIQ